MRPTAIAVCALLIVPGALAQVRGAKPAPNDDLRPAYANAADIAEGKRVAQASCAGCHGVNGISSMKAVPHLAGQRPAYLYAELKVYQAGGRGENPMSNAVKFLKEDALYKVAAYYASLEPAAPAAGSARSSPAKPDPVQAGKAAAATCAGCHGDTGVSTMPGTPSLAGLDPKYLVAATKAYRNDQRKSDVMKPLAATLSETDLNNVALFFALQKPARAQAPAAGDASAGKAAAAACAGCHGDNGVSSNSANPSLAGQEAQYLANALLAYKQGTRSEETMKGVAAALDEAAIKNLAAYYAAQQPQGANVRKPVSTAQWVQRCDRCHGMGGNSTDPRLPAIAAQREDYLQKVLNAYRTGERKSSQMAAMSAGLSEADAASLAAYYARQKSRAVIFIVLPPK
ncbi:MAG TPA: c-type cytochrome [Burkholderiales bacterium]|nr:c-type cytochrome [Burkholderiales bacterium]